MGFRVSSFSLPFRSSLRLRVMGFLLLLYISPVIRRFSLHTEGYPCLLFRLTAVIPPLGRRFSICFLVLSFYELYPVLRVCYLIWHCLGPLFSPSFGYGLAVFSSLQPAWWVVLSVGIVRGLYLRSFSFLISPFTFFHKWPSLR